MTHSQLSTTRLAIRQVSGRVATVLMPLGFRRQGVHLWRDSDGLTHAIRFQASEWGTIDSGSFTINLGISSPLLYYAFSGGSYPKNPATALWPINLRIGRLMPENLDRWWEVTCHDDIPQIEEGVIDALLNYAIPYFDQVATTRELRTLVSGEYRVLGLLEPQRKIVAAILAHMDGDKPAASALLRSELLRLEGKPFQDAVSNVAARLGATLL